MGTGSATAPETLLPRAGGRPRLLQGQAQWARQATCPAQPSSARRTPSPDQPPEAGTLRFRGRNRVTWPNNESLGYRLFSAGYF